jgi:hypothetical protein
MCILYNKIKFGVDINNDELLKTIWEHMKEIKRGQGGGERDIIELINFYCIHHYSFFFFLNNYLILFPSLAWT